MARFFPRWFANTHWAIADVEQKDCPCWKRNSIATSRAGLTLPCRTASSPCLQMREFCTTCPYTIMSTSMSPEPCMCFNCAYYGFSHTLHSVVLVHDSRGVHHVLPGFGAVSLPEHASHQPRHAPSLLRQISLGTTICHRETHHHAGLFHPHDLPTQQVVGVWPSQPFARQS